MIKDLFDGLRRELRRLEDQLKRWLENDLAQSERLKFLVAGGTAIVLLLVLTAVAHWSSAVLEEYRSKQIAYARLKMQVETQLWPERRAQSQALKLALQERLWTANTPGLAEAGFERWLRDHLGRYQLEPQSVQVHRVPVLVAGADRVDRSHSALTDIQRMTAKVMMPFDQTGLLSFLDDIAESDKTVVIDRLMVHAGRNARVEMDVSTFFPFHEPEP